jgi:hypothetical protein
LVTVALPFDEQDAAAVVIVGTEGTVSWAAMLKEALESEVHVPFEAVTV